MKRLVAFGMCLIIILGCAVTVAAAGTELKVSTSEMQVGETITLTVSVSGASPAKSVGLAVKYNSNCFELVSAEWLLLDAMMSAVDISTAKAALMYAQTTDMNGQLFGITLRAISPTQTAEGVSVEISLRDGVTDVYSGTAEASITITEGQIPPVETEPPATESSTQTAPETGIQGTVNVPMNAPANLPEKEASDDVVAEITPVEENSNTEVLATDKSEVETTEEGNKAVFPWYIAIIVAAIVVVVLLLWRRKKTK